MASTPSNRLRLTPSNSPFLQRPSRFPIRPRHSPHDSRLSLKRVIGTTCSSPTGFDTVESSFAYVAGGAVVVVDVQGDHYSQRFYRARPTAVPVYGVSPVVHAPATPNSTPKANDSRNRVAVSPRDSLYGPLDWSESPSPRTWTSRERIKAATSLALSRDGKYLAVGETGYAPRVLIYNLQDQSSDTPLVSISEHLFGVRAVAWSPDTRYLASLGAANDGFLYVWKIDPRSGAAKLFQQNRCTSFIRGMVWMGANLITLGVRHIKVWRVEQGQAAQQGQGHGQGQSQGQAQGQAQAQQQHSSPTKTKFAGENCSQSQTQRTLPGRNILLGSLLDSTFTCAVALDEERALICSETGDVCLLDDTNKQMKLIRTHQAGFTTSCISIRRDNVYIGGKGGELAVLSLDRLLNARSEPVTKQSRGSNGFIAMGFLGDKMVTIDAKRSIDVWASDYTPVVDGGNAAHIPIPGHGDPIIGIQQLHGECASGASFFTWSGSGRVNLWDLCGQVKSSFDIAVEQADSASEPDRDNQLVIVRATNGGNQFIAGDKLGVLRIIDHATKECRMETKAHASDCQDITVYENERRVLVASCGRDRTVQLFHKQADGDFGHFQTLEFAARVVQVLIPSDDRILTCSLDRTLQIYGLVSREGEPDIMAAVPLKVISLKASPSSMVMAPDGKSIFVSLLDRSVCQYDIETGRLSNSFKCIDEGGIESVVLDSLTYGKSIIQEPSFLLGVSNTDKSVRIYDSQTGAFLDREWGHTEAINGVLLLENEDASRKVVSVGSDGTIMIWTMDLQDSLGSSADRDRDPSPEKPPFSTSSRPPLRRVLSKAELAEFQRPSPSPNGRRSPPRSLRRRTSKYNNLTLSATRSPNTQSQTSPSSAIAEDTPTRRPSSGGSRSGSPESPKARARMTRRPSLPVLNGASPSNAPASRKKSSTNLRGGYGFGSLSMATEQTCRQLRAYRKKLVSSDSISSDVLTDLDAELRLTVAALSERAARSRNVKDSKGRESPVSETVLSGLLDQYSERLMTMLNEKLQLKLDDGKDSDKERPKTASDTSNSSSTSLSCDGDSAS